jgi:hypothetical protein
LRFLALAASRAFRSKFKTEVLCKVLSGSELDISLPTHKAPKDGVVYS